MGQIWRRDIDQSMVRLLLTTAVLCLTLCLSSVLCLSAQAYAAKLLKYDALSSWRTDEGLPQDFITAIAQTPDGFLWVGTMSGLVRFDGMRFLSFPARNKENNLQQRVTSLVTATDGSLWIGTSMGLTHYLNGKFISLPNQSGSTRFAVDDLTSTPNGGVWLSSRGHLFAVNNHTFHPYPLPVDGHPGGMRMIAEAPDGTLWIAGSEGVYALRNGKLSEHYGDAEGLPSTNISLVHADVFGNVYAGDGHHLFRLEQDRFKLVPHPGLDNFVSILTDRQRNLWMASGGLHGISRNTNGHIDSFTTTQNLLSDDARILFEDHSGDIWIGTIAGLQRLHNGRFTTFTAADGLPQGRNQYDAVFEDKNHDIWVGSLEDGVGRIHDGKFERFSYAEGLKRGQVRGFADSQAGLVVAISDYGLFRLNGRRFVPIPGIPHGYITSPISDQSGALWFAVNGNGVFRLDHGALRHFTTADGLPSMRATSLLLDRQDTVVVATSEGISQFTHDRFVAIANISAISIGRDNKRDGLWLGTDDGLVFLKSARTRRITEAQGLPGNLVLAVTTDDADNLWVTTANTIAEIDHLQVDAVLGGTKKSFWPKRFTQADGLGSRDVLPIGQVNMVRASDGCIWLATANGLSVGEKEVVPAPPAHVFIESIAIDEVTQPLAQRVAVPPGRHRLTVAFTAPDLHSPEQLRFRYRLNGWDKEWLDTTSERVISYTGLPPGDYQLKIAAANEDGVWSGEEASVEVHIRPFFYQTKLFTFLACLTCVGLVIEITRRRTKHTAEQSRLRSQERSAERERIGYEIHDTIIQDLVGTALQLELIGMQLQEHPEKTERLLSDLTARMREMVGKSRDMVSTLHSMAASHRQLIEMLREAAAEFRLGEIPSLKIEATGKQPAIESLIMDEIYRICREALANAFRHSNATLVEVHATYTEEEIDISISDDGTGMNQETLRNGRLGHFGLSGMQAHAQRIGATVVIESQPGQGTRVQLSVPTITRRWWHRMRDLTASNVR